jgi:hypothetical protein
MEGEEEGGGVTLLQATARRRPPAKGQGKLGPWGVLTLTSHCLSFREEEAADDVDDARTVVRVPLSDVAAHFVTPPSAKLICLKITTDDDDNDPDATNEGGQDEGVAKKRKGGTKGGQELVFEFTPGAGAERDSFRDLIAQLVPPLRRLKRPKLTTSLVPAPQVCTWGPPHAR